MDAGERCLALGTSTGAVHLFDRGSLHAGRLIPVAATQHGAVSCARFGPDDNILAAGTTRGAVAVRELNLDARRAQERRLCPR